MRVDAPVPKSYIIYQGPGDDSDNAHAHAHVREMLAARRREIERGRDAVRDILATDDPEAAEQLLCDGTRIQITETILRPQTGRAAVADFVSQRFSAGTRSSAPTDVVE